ncbi:hypothetical protein [Telmatospirillum sp.]|uniref:hypothetical protein n=1 Tax=Telmatospirillum sp. TaxID=2079197 RepID=UPI002847287F|nr:hypothetical protein [Telmatospirillum sp.]MDR3436433.1 hypothetical protein [Telmatospirillum sp.]
MAEFNNVYGSLSNFLNVFIATLSYDAVFVDFDQYVSLDTLPYENIVGVRGFTVDSGRITIGVQVMFCVTTIDDQSMFAHRDILDQLFTLCLPTKSIPYLDGTTGDVLGQFTIADGTSILPVHRSTARTFQMMMVNLLGDRKPAL